MLKKMQWRFIRAAMASVFVVLTAIVVCINVLSYTSTTNRIDGMLNMIMERRNPGELPFGDGGGRDEWDFRRESPEMRYMMRFFSVQIDENGENINVSRDFIASISEEDAIEYAKTVLSKNKTNGFYKEYRYLVQNNDGTEKVVFLNSANELRFIKTLLIISCATAAVSLLAVFILIAAFSKKAIEPYVRNIEMQKQFITDAGHEIKTPLTSISTSADVLAMDYGENEWITNIQKQTNRLAKLVTNLVTLSRLDEPVPFPEKTVFSLSDLLWEASESFDVLAKAKGKSFEHSIEDSLELCGDRETVRQMISILLDNALKYSDEKGNINVKAFRKKKNTVIEISNTCILPENIDLNRLFDRFYRPDKSRSTNSGGNGIGLSIAKAAAEVSGGTITAERVNENEILFRIIL